MQVRSEHEIILDRSLALLTLAAAAAYAYGVRIWLLCGTAACVSMLSELICLYIRRIPFRLRHLDAAVSGVVLTMLLPPTVPLSLLIMSCIFANIIGRQLFGGRDNPVIPPAAVGYCFALMNSADAVTLFPKTVERLPVFLTDGTELTEGISRMWNHTGRFSASVFEWLTGLPSQPIGTGSVIILAVVFLVLLCRRSASGAVMLPMLVIQVGFSMLIGYMRHPLTDAVGGLLTNQMLFAILFLYGDRDFAPRGLSGFLFGMIAGGLCIICTRYLYVTDAPLLLAVILSPVAAGLRPVKQSRKKGGAHHGKPHTVRRVSPSPKSAAS